MELTHRLTQHVLEHANAEEGELQYSDGVFSEGTGGDDTSKAFYLNAGDTITFYSYCKEHGTYPIITDTWQQILICDEYKSGEAYEALNKITQHNTLVRYTASKDCYVVIGTNYGPYLSEINVTIDKSIITSISEPIGFDNLKVQIRRHEYHGIGAESSIDALEFYGNAIDIIRNAYEIDIDSSIVYDVLDGSTIIYTGMLDLSTYKELRGDYNSISCQVGEIGAKTTFNNRTEASIDIDAPKTVDGAPVTIPTWRDVHIPKKSLLYTNKMQEKLTRIIDSRDNWGSGDGKPDDIIGDFVLSQSVVNEYGVVLNEGLLFSKDEDFDKKYGINTTSHIEFDMSFRVSWDVSYSIGSFSIYGEVYLYSGDLIIGIAQFNMNTSSANQDTKKLVWRVYLAELENKPLKLSYRFWQTGDGQNKRIYNNIKLEILGGAEFKMTMYDTLPDDDVETKMIPVEDALRTVVSAISENQLTFASEWYHQPTPGQPFMGGGTSKAITNGYKIRGLFGNEEKKRNMPLSFKSLIQSLDAMDCIGWGFYGDEVHVERWDWFYKDELLLTLENVSEINVEVDPGRIPTELQIGYKKYATNEQYNSIDSPHGKRTFTSGIKAVSNVIVKESEFIADNYAIEETRRARTQVSETEETNYDENIFIFELDSHYEIAHSATEAQNVGRAEEFINAVLTPRHMAARWRSFLFSTNNTSPFRFTSGDINYLAYFGIDESETGLENMAITSPQGENDNITHTPACFKAERITFSYPLTIEQYNTVKANPYGIIRATDVAGVTHEGWIIDFKYSLDGMADFVLIARNNQVNE